VSDQAETGDMDRGFAGRPYVGLCGCAPLIDDPRRHGDNVRLTS